MSDADRRPAAAFARYEEERVAITREMQLVSRKVGIATAKRAG